MSTELVETKDSLEQELEAVKGVQKEYLLLKILGFDHKTILKVLETDDYLEHWKRDKNFNNMFKSSKALDKRFHSEAISLIRKDSKANIVVMELLLSKKLLEEVLGGTPVFIKTHLGRDVYSRLMADKDSDKEPGGSWEELILKRHVSIETPQRVETPIEGECSEIQED